MAVERTRPDPGCSAARSCAYNVSRSPSRPGFKRVLMSCAHMFGFLSQSLRLLEGLRELDEGADAVAGAAARVVAVVGGRACGPRDVEVHPRRAVHELAQEQARGERAAASAGADVA